MNPFTPKQWRAIAYYCKSNDARPLMTVPPDVRIEVKSTGKILTRRIDQLVTDLDEHLAQQRDEKARIRIEEKRASAPRYQV